MGVGKSYNGSRNIGGGNQGIYGDLNFALANKVNSYFEISVASRVVNTPMPVAHPRLPFCDMKFLKQLNNPYSESRAL